MLLVKVGCWWQRFSPPPTAARVGGEAHGVRRNFREACEIVEGGEESPLSGAEAFRYEWGSEDTISSRAKGLYQS